MEYSAKGTSAPKSMCQKKSFRSSASGAVIKRAPNGSFVLTAAHVCDDSGIQNYIDSFFKSEAPELIKDVKKELVFIGKTLDGKKYNINIEVK